jgi:sterol desaturase/sphingolipid hydroxylase (fatty acid hydroxylase superfamily)
MDTEPLVRIVAFVGVLAVMATWEVLAPRRELRVAKLGRWLRNLAVVVLDTVFVRVLFAAGALGVAVVATDHRWGVLNHVGWPSWLEGLLAVVVLDFVLYLQHVMFHAIPLFWRFHMMHHADLDCDVTTGVRFHPVEVVLSMVIKLSAIILLGASVTAVLSFELLLNATSMFNHSNVRMPAIADQLLRWVIVTPDMHRIHHSIDALETNRNFGFSLPWWDRVFGTYRAEPFEGHQEMMLGLQQFRDPARLTFTGMLTLPFVGPTGNYPLSREG